MFAIANYKSQRFYAMGANIDEEIVVQDFIEYQPTAKETEFLKSASEQSILEKCESYFYY